ncbi:hypothetical protein GOD54_23455 [Sinorhizobium medicae]|nr:hypothetical protein [Sinorhizobium medicae]
MSTQAQVLSVLDVLHAKAFELQRKLFKFMPSDHAYSNAVSSLAALKLTFDVANAKDVLAEDAASHFDAAWFADVPALPSTDAEWDAHGKALEAELDSDLEYATYYAKKARTCSIDAVLAGKSGRADIRAQLRSMRDIYAHKARWLYNGAHYGALFTPCMGRG